MKVMIIICLFGIGSLLENIFNYCISLLFINNCGRLIEKSN